MKWEPIICQGGVVEDYRVTEGTAYNEYFKGQNIQEDEVQAGGVWHLGVGEEVISIEETRENADKAVDACMQRMTGD